MNKLTGVLLAVVIALGIAVGVQAQQAVNVTKVNGSAPPAAICSDPTKITNYNLNKTAATGSSELIPLSGSTLIYLCDWDLIVGGADTTQLTYGTGTNCGTGETILRTYNFAAAGDGISKSGGGAALIAVPSGKALCLKRTNSVTASGGVGYVQQNAP